MVRLLNYANKEKSKHQRHINIQAAMFSRFIWTTATGG